MKNIDRILIADDDLQMLELLTAILEEEGFDEISLIRLSSNLEGLSTTEVISEILERFV